MKFVCILVLVIVPLLNGFCQINIGEIKAMTSDRSSKYFYDTLLIDFLEQPQEFEMTKSICVYYGKLFSSAYKPYYVNESEAGFDEFFRRENYSRAIALGERVLEKDPVNFPVLLKLMKCYFESKEVELAELTKAKAQVLHKAILHSGTGDEEATAIQIVDVSDEYALMGLMGVEPLSRKSHSKGSSVIDRWKIRESQTGKKRDLYFELLLNLDAVHDPNKGD